MTSMASHTTHRLAKQTPLQNVTEKESGNAQRRRLLKMIVNSESSRKNQKGVTAS